MHAVCLLPMVSHLQLPPPAPPAGRPSSLATLCEELSCIESVASWSAGCVLPEQAWRTSGI